MAAEQDASQARIAIIEKEKCKPNKCRLECKRACPIVRGGKECIRVARNSRIAELSETLCIGCGICVKKCPFDAITIINLPASLASETSHRYSANSFKLCRIPIPRSRAVLGLVGTNGIGKSTALKILAGKLKPNLGRFDDPPDWEEILRYWRGSEMQNYLQRIIEDNLKAIIKPQYVDHIPKAINGVSVGAVLGRKDQRGCVELITRELDLQHVMDRDVELLSGGELQRFAIAVVVVQQADVYMFDEPSSYLDVRQRLKAALVIRSLIGDGSVDEEATVLELQAADESAEQTHVIVVEHDLSVLDYLSDFVCVLYGKPGAYGVVTMPFSVREGINHFLAGFVPTENLRFREESLSFRVAQSADDAALAEQADTIAQYSYPTMRKTLTNKKGTRSFILNVEAGQFTDSQIIVLLGENGTGKSTFIRMLAGLLKSDEQTAYIASQVAEGKEEEEVAIPEELGTPRLTVSYKPQKISPSFKGTVRMLLHRRIRDAYMHPQFVTDVTRPLVIEPLMDQEVINLSGGELQRVAITLCLGRPAAVYLIDEPSAYLDSEQRIIAAKVIKRFILHAKKTAFVVEHDFIMATYLADRVVVYSGQPAVETTAHSPESLLTGMNSFLRALQITFRRDPTNYRPRINKFNSMKDREQKSTGQYFFLDDE